MPRKKKAAPKVESMRLDALKPNPGSRKAKRRIGRGPGSGRGKTAGAGHKGQLSRTGFSRQRGFEGGQMPLHRRLPKRGFRNIFRKEFVVVNLDQIAQFQGEVTPSNLLTTKVIKRLRDGVAILGRGEAPKGLRVLAHRFSRTARQKIEAAGGTAEVIVSVRKPIKRPNKGSGAKKAEKE